MKSKIKYLLLLALCTGLYSCKKGDSNDVSPVKAITPATSVNNITAYLVVIKANTDTTQSAVVEVQ
jgi:hypothetical protein